MDALAGAGTKIPTDFHNRCIFEVLSEGGSKASDEPICYGAVIQLRHVKTGFLLLADAVKGPAGGGGRAHVNMNRSFVRSEKGEEAVCYTRLKNASKALEASSAQFYLRPRYTRPRGSTRCAVPRAHPTPASPGSLLASCLRHFGQVLGACGG
jgi:hypothetical protein